MFVCLCHGISDKKLRKLAIEEGINDMRTIRRCTSLGSQCGKCIKQVPIEDVAKRATVWVIRNQSKWFEKMPDSIGGLRWKPKDIGRKYVPFYSDSRTNKKGGKK